LLQRTHFISQTETKEREGRTQVRIFTLEGKYPRQGVASSFAQLN